MLGALARTGKQCKCNGPLPVADATHLFYSRGGRCQGSSPDPNCGQGHRVLKARACHPASWTATCLKRAIASSYQQLSQCSRRRLEQAAFACPTTTSCLACRSMIDRLSRQGGQLGMRDLIIEVACRWRSNVKDLAVHEVT